MKKTKLIYKNKNIDHIAFPMGGIGAGMMCLEGTGSINHVSLWNEMRFNHQPNIFASIFSQEEPKTAKVLEGQVPKHKYYGPIGTGNGGRNTNYGLPRFKSAEFENKFPFGIVNLEDNDLPIKCKITGWSPFIPGDSKNSSLPVTGIEYSFENESVNNLNLIFSYHIENFISKNKSKNSIYPIENGIHIQSDEIENGIPYRQLRIIVDDPNSVIDCAWFRGDWFDTKTILWNNISNGMIPNASVHKEGAASDGGSIYVPFSLKPNESKQISLKICWYTTNTDFNYENIINFDNNLKNDCCIQNDKSNTKNHIPWYCGQFNNISSLQKYWLSNYDDLKDESINFTECFFSMTLPKEVVDAVSSNLSILKSPTVQRQTDGKLWAWEGCFDDGGCCAGSCTHVWNYAQALPHLFPDLERSLRDTEFFFNQNDKGHQDFRAQLPISQNTHVFHSAVDGQLGGIMKIYRDWRISGNNDWIKEYWEKIESSINYSINTWDPNNLGVLTEPQHNTYDIEFWGPNGMCTTFYLGALKAVIEIGQFLNKNIDKYIKLYKKGQNYLDNELWNGEYYIQNITKVDTNNNSPLEASSLKTTYSREAKSLLENEGPKYQYGKGCLSDGILGSWMAKVSNLDNFLNQDNEKKNLLSIFEYNFKNTLINHANPQRPTYALGDDGGLLLCTWPKGGELSLPFVYSDEVWTGIEYAVASHLMFLGETEKGLEIVKTCRKRYDGSVRNPFDEYECGHWYARAMSSYSLLQGLTGIYFDAVNKNLYINPRIEGDFISFLSVDGGFGHVGIKNNKPFIKMFKGNLKFENIYYNNNKYINN